MKASEFRDRMITAYLVLQVYLEESLSPVCREWGVTMQQFRILMELGKHPCRTAGDLSDIVGVQRGNMAGICKKMEQNGWIVRERKPQDERVVLISMTEEGKNLKKEIEDRIEKKLNTVLDGEPDETVETIFNGMDALSRLMEKLGK